MAKLPAAFRFTWPQIGVLAAAVGAAAALQAWAHWSAWPALGMVVVVTIVGRVITDMWPRRIPAELRDQAEKLRSAGWRPLRHHPFLCTETRPHMHVAQPGGKPVRITRLNEGDVPGA